MADPNWCLLEQDEYNTRNYNQYFNQFMQQDETSSMKFVKKETRASSLDRGNINMKHRVKKGAWIE